MFVKLLNIVRWLPQLEGSSAQGELRNVAESDSLDC
jgi:hypothetical protein